MSHTLYLQTCAVLWSDLKKGLYRIQILCRRYPFWSYPAVTIADPPGKQKLNYRRVYAHHYCRVYSQHTKFYTGPLLNIHHAPTLTFAFQTSVLKDYCRLFFLPMRSSQLASALPGESFVYLLHPHDSISASSSHPLISMSADVWYILQTSLKHRFGRSLTVASASWKRL